MKFLLSGASANTITCNCSKGRLSITATINCITQIGHIEHVIKQKCFKEKKRKLYKIEKFEQITTEQNEKIDELITNEENFLQEVLEQDESVKNERTTGHGPSFQTT